MNPQTANPLVATMVAHGQVTLDLVWAMQWLDTLADCLAEHHMVAEFLADLEQRRTTSVALNAAAKEAEL